MLPNTPSCAGLLLVVCAAVQGASVTEPPSTRTTKQKAVPMIHDVVLVFGPGSVPNRAAFGPDSGLGDDCRNATSCPENQQCSEDDGVCTCAPGYQWSQIQNKQICSKCPGPSNSCGENGCCYPADKTRCYNDVCQCKYESGECSANISDQFRMATQIALVSAIILVIACLLVILWRTCRKQHGHRQRRRVRRRSDASEASLTSVQLRVVERLRNRPPGYHDRTHIRIEKPPSYEETIGQPLRFPALVLDPSLCPLDTAPCPLDSAADPDAAPPCYQEPSYQEPSYQEPSYQEPSYQEAGEAARASGGGADNPAFAGDESEAKQTPAPELHM